jgi:hypothetical protein
LKNPDDGFMTFLRELQGPSLLSFQKEMVLYVLLHPPKST